LPLFGRPAPIPADLASYVPTPPKLRVLRADGARIDLSSRDAGQLLVATRQSWQATAWSYRDLIGELRYAIRLLARHVARARFYAAEVRAWPDDPAALDSDEHGVDRQLAADAVFNLSLLPLATSPDGFIARLTENLAVAGEGWVHIDPDDVVHVRSTSEILASADGRVTISALPRATSNTSRVLDPTQEDLLRCWVPHPEWGQLADSALRTMLDTCEDVVLSGREMRAAARSRIAANGVLLVPAALSMARTADTEDADDPLADTFMADFTDAMLAPIRDDGDPQAVVPIVLRGEAEDLDKVRHLTLQRADTETLIERQSSAILRLLRGLDIQPEQVEGLGSLNHWSGWQVDARAIKDQVLPWAETVAACLAQAFLRPALIALGHDPAAVAKVTIAVDVSDLAENPNRGQDARDAHAAFAISDAALRTALGFDDDDAPDEQEWLRRVAASGRFDVSTAAAVLGVRQQRVVDSPPDPALPPAPPGDTSDDDARPVARPGETSPAQPLPRSGGQQPERAPIVAAATAGTEWEWRVVDGRVLADIDAALTDRICIAADAAVARIVERAGARVRNAAQRDRPLAASLANIPAAHVAARLGREQTEQFVPIRDLIADTHIRLRGLIRQWLTAAARRAGDQLGKTIGGARGARLRAAVTARLTARVDDAWQHLAGVLDEAAERALFADDPHTSDPGRGEPVTTLVRPADVVDVLTVAGGGTPTAPARDDRQVPTPTPAEPGGFATGPAARQAVAAEGGVLIGWEWLYRPEIVRDTFDPHKQLDGVRFQTWTDPKLDTGPTSAWIGPFFRPQDHRGCRCTASPVWVVPDLDDDIVARRLREAQGDPRNLLAAQVAADDDMAGRVGTTLQNEVEVRSRIWADVQRLTRQHIDGTEETP